MAVKDDGVIRLLMINTVRSGYNGQMMFILKYLRAMDRGDMRIGYASKAAPLPEIRAELESMGVRVHVLPDRTERPLGYTAELARLIRREGYDIAHVHGNSATMALELMAARRGSAAVRIAHSHNTSTKHPMVHRAMMPLMLREANARMACGEAAGRWLFGKLPFEIIPIASDPSVYAFDADQRAKLRSAMGCGPEDVLVGIIGQLNAVKNHAFLLKAFARAHSRNPRLKLMVIGSGTRREALGETVRSLRLESAVEFTGAVEDVPARMQALDLVAMPSLYEGFPNVLVEAQLAGLPALVSDSVTRDCDMTGLITYLPLKEDAWTRALETAAPIDRATASRRAAERIAQRGYDIHTAAARLKARYAQLLEEKGRA